MKASGAPVSGSLSRYEAWSVGSPRFRFASTTLTSLAPSACCRGSAEIMPRNRPPFAMGRTARGRAGARPAAASRNAASTAAMTVAGSSTRSRSARVEDEHQAAVAARLIMRLIVASRTSSPRWFSTSCV